MRPSVRSGSALLLALALAAGVASSGPPPPPATAQPAPTPVPAATSTPVPLFQLGTWNLVDPAFTPHPDATPYWGVLGRAAFRMEVPHRWNGDLVMYAHGYRGEGPNLTVSNPPIRDYLIANGYAWAASSYSQNGYMPDVAVADTLALRRYFVERVAPPRRTYLEGTSMGGHVVVASLEQFPNAYDGALAECGVMMQVQELDYLMANASVADFLSGANALPAENAERYAALVRDTYLPAFGGLENTTEAGRRFDSVVKHLTGGARPWRVQGMIDFNAMNSGAITNVPGTSPSGLARTNTEFRFRIDPGLGLTEEELNAGVKRYPANPLVRNPGTNPTFSLPTGAIRVPLVSYHTTGDNFVPLLHQINYRRVVDAAGRGDLLVQRTVRAPRHCQFSPGDLEEGFADLVDWVDRGVKPAGEDLLNEDRTDLGRRWTHNFLPGDPGKE